MKVAKFGGSSVADSKQFKKVANIIKADPKRKIYCSVCTRKTI